MGQVIETAIALVIVLILIFSLVWWELQFTKTISHEARSYHGLNFQMLDLLDLYKIEKLERDHPKTGGSLPYVKASPPKIIEAVRLVEDIFYLQKRREELAYPVIELPGHEAEETKTPVKPGNGSPALPTNPWLNPEQNEPSQP